MERECVRKKWENIYFAKKFINEITAEWKKP